MLALFVVATAPGAGSQPQFTALREFTLNGTDHTTYREQDSMIRSYIAWRNRHTDDPRLRRIIDRAT